MSTNEHDGEASAPQQLNESVIDKAAIERFADAIARLNNDSRWFLEALTEYVYSLQPISKDRLTEAERRYLVESGVFTQERLADAEADVDRGSLQLREIEGWLSHLSETTSLAGAAGFLGITESEAI